LKATWIDILKQVQRVQQRNPDVTCLYGVPTGGSVVASMFGLPILSPDLTVDELSSVPGLLVVDDLVDSGKTLAPYRQAGLAVDALYRKPYSPRHLAPGATEANEWIEFPWEAKGAPEDAVVRLLQFIGEDPTREGLLDTPRRVTKAWREMTEGMLVDPATVLGTVFENEGYDEMVVVRGIRFVSLCEHHFLPFTGEAIVAYVPGEKIVGLSKIPRLVETYAKRPQNQERLTFQIAETMEQTLKPLGVGVMMKGHHSCMGCRGVRQPDADMVTSCVKGVLKEDPKARAELLALWK
tara:strand:- start:716 stop:1600 length:885 start_codon:yes stop_codon:yes gene_type:complete